MPLRTDLAHESAKHLPENLGGIEQKKLSCGGLDILRTEIKTDAAAAALSKPVGHYATISSKAFSLQSSPQEFSERAHAIAKEISLLCGHIGSAIVIGLGNRSITPDRLGPAVADKVIATRHIHRLAKDIDVSSMAETSVLTTGVMGQTGIEAAEIAKAVADRIRPDVAIVIDALACCEYESLGSCIQLCDTGISPGSGVENARAEFSRATLGAPTVAIGVPTVMDARSLCDSEQYGDMFITPRSIDTLIERTSSLIALSVNLALYPDMTAEEILSLT